MFTIDSLFCCVLTGWVVGDVAACSLGAAQASLDFARNYMTERKQFGKPLASFQVPPLEWETE